MEVTGVIMCGGKSTRMGRDKSLLIYHGRSQRLHLKDLLSPFCTEIFFSLNPDQTDDPAMVITDLPEFVNLGPATGFLSAFSKLPGKNILFVGCDYPFITSNELKRFFEFSIETGLSAFFNPGGFYEPLLSFVPHSCRDKFIQQLRLTGSSQEALKACNAFRYLPEDLSTMQSVDDLATFMSISNMNPGEKQFRIVRAGLQGQPDSEDIVAVEEPLQINIITKHDDERIVKPLAVTMRTPGNDADLARGFLITEGIISSNATILVSHTPGSHEITMECTNESPVLTNVERNFYATSSCGVCGKSSVSKIKTNCPSITSTKVVDGNILHRLPGILRENQGNFRRTGGVHACALFSEAGEFLLLREDVGRHNAMDKLAGALAGMNKLPADCCILLLSGRAGFEMIQKAAMCGISIIASIGAPTSLAIETADECNITLIGFLRETGFNIYTHPYRIQTAYEDQDQRQLSADEAE